MWQSLKRMSGEARMTDVVRMTIHENHQVHMIAINGLYSKLQKLPISTMVEPEQEMVITCKIPDLTAGEWCFHLTLHTLLLYHSHPHSYTPSFIHTHIQLSYASASSSLNDRTRFPNFWRTYPSNDNLAQSIVAVVMHYGWI